MFSSISCYFQLLKAWHKDPSIAHYDVRDLIEELQEWVDEGFLEKDIWSTLQKRVNPSTLSHFNIAEQIDETSGTMKPQSPVDTPFLQVSSTKTIQFQTYIFQCHCRI